MSKPRVTAEHETWPATTRAICSPRAHESPGVLISVTFDLHDHAAALAALERAVEDVRAQIEETK